ncbi:MAG: RNA polymerase-binding protein DksA [Comamonadaceae bacterium]|nr:RNA polymerase-binding protein DksA [Comamonadaceae bacterium]
MKAPATRTAKPTPPARAAAQGRPSPTKAKAVVAAKPTAKAAAKTVKKAAPAPVARKAAAKPPAATKPVVKPVTKPVVKPSPKASVKPVAKASVKPVAKASPPQPAAKAPAKAVTTPSKSLPKAVAPPVAVSPAPAAKRAVAAAPAPIVVEPTPRPLGKRAAKKVMMEQMTQAAVVPTHAPDAAKATFFTMNERVMTPPVPSSIQKDPKRANHWKTLPLEQLTDQDVQAMPDSEYMNDVQLAFFRRKLSLLKADMLANAGETTEHLREDTVVVPDPADRATIEEEHALELRTRDRERKLLKKIEQAIVRIDAGDYGYCEETGEAIGVGRLMARPTASLSLEAQQRRELKQKMFGD